MFYVLSVVLNISTGVERPSISAAPCLNGGVEGLVVLGNVFHKNSVIIRQNNISLGTSLIPHSDSEIPNGNYCFPEFSA